MFSVYAVRVLRGIKHRHFLGRRETDMAAKHLANCATLGNADYAYVKDTDGATVFYLRADPDLVYGANAPPAEKCRPLPPVLEV